MSRQVADTYPPSPLPRNIAAARAAKGITFEQLSRDVGVTLRTVMRWEYGESTPSYPDLVRLADALNVRVSWLYEERKAA